MFIMMINDAFSFFLVAIGILAIGIHNIEVLDKYR